MKTRPLHARLCLFLPLLLLARVRSSRYRKGAMFPALALVCAVLGGWLPQQAAAQFSESSWTTHTAIPVPRGQAATTVDAAGRIYVIGGYQAGTLAATNYRFTPGTPGSWETLAPMPVANRGASAVHQNGVIYVFGGYPNTTTFQTYTIATNNWSSATTANLGWENASAISSGGRVFITGGESSTTSFYEFTPPATFTLLAPRLTSAIQNRVAVIGGTLFSVGGADASYNPTEAVDSYSLAGNTWSTAPANLPLPLTQSAMAAQDIYLFVAGGSSGTSLAGSNYGVPGTTGVYVYNSVLNSWSAGPSLPVGTREATAAVSGGRLYVLGGGTTTDTAAVYSIGLVSSSPAVTLTTTSVAATATTLTITGTNFDATTPGNNTVAFSPAGTGTVTAATTTSLTVTGVSDLRGGPLSAVVTNTAGNSGSAVQVAAVAPVVTTSTASLFDNATTLTINGFGFDPTAGNNSVAFTPSGTGTVTAATATTLTVTGITGLTNGRLNAVVTTNSVASTSAQVAAVVTPPPAVTAISPLLGTTAGGTQVTVTGTNFTGATGVTIGGTAATGVSVQGDTTLTCITPAHAEGTASVVVTTPQGSNGANALYTYAVVPAIAVSNASGTSLADNTGTQGLGSVRVGGSMTQTFTIQNLGSGNLTLPATPLSVSDPVQFNFTAPAVATLAPNASTTFTLTFTPASPGLKTALVSLASNDPNVSPFRINVTGTGLASYTGSAIISDDFNRANQALRGTTPATTIISPAPTYQIEGSLLSWSPVAIQSNRAYLDSDIGLNVAISSSGAYTKPSVIRLSASLNLGTITSGTGRGVGLGCYTGFTPNPFSNNVHGSDDNARGLLLDRSGNVTLHLPSGDGLSIPYSSALFGGAAFNPSVSHTLSYQFDTTTGDVASVMLDGVQIGGFAAAGFTDAATPRAGFWVSSATGHTSGYVDNFKVEALTVLPPPTVTVSTASLAATTTSLVITGTNFDAFAGNNTVTFSPAGTGTVTAATATSLTVSNITGLVAGPLNAVVTTSSGSSSSTQVATVYAVPTVTTLAATALTSNTATLNGTVNDNFASTTVSFDYGLTTAYGSTAAATPGTLSGGIGTAVTAALTGLTPNTTYHFRVKAVNTAGTVTGGDLTFTTQPSPANVVWDSFTGASEYRAFFTPPPFLGQAFTLSNAGGTSNIAITGGTFYMSSYTATTYTDVQVTIDIWGTASGVSSGTTPAFSNLLTSYTLDLGARSTGANVYYSFNFTLPSPVTLPTQTGGISFGFKGNTGSGLVATSNLGILLRDGTYPVATGTPAAGIAPTFGFYAPFSSGEADGNFQGSDFFTGIGANGTLAFILKTSTAASTAVAPVALTNTASAITGNGATLNGYVFPGGAPATAWFEYGITTSYGATVPLTLSPNNGTGWQTLSYALSGLTGGTTYHYRIVAHSDYGTSNGADVAFTNPLSPTITPTTTVLLATASTVTITGANFDAVTPGNNIVAFSPAGTGTVTVATATSLTVTGVTGLRGGALSAIVTNAGGSSGSAVQVATISPVVTLGTAPLLPSSSTLTINGFGFSPTAGANTVAFTPAGTTGTVATATTTSLTVNVSGLVAGPLSAVITTNAVGSGSPVQVATVGSISSMFNANVDATPGVTGGAWASFRSGMTMASSGAMAYRGYLAISGSVTANNFQGIWKCTDGILGDSTLVTRSGVTLEPSTGSALFDVLPLNPVINNAGQASFIGFLRVGSGSPAVTSSTDTGVWSELGTGGLKKLVREGDTLSGSTVSTVAPSTWIAEGDTAAAFAVKLGTGSALVRVDVAGATVTPSFIVKEGDTAPVLTGGDAGTFDSMVGNENDPRMDAAGNVAFLGNVLPSGQGIWYKTAAGALASVANTHEAAPGLGGPVFTGFERPSLSGDGSTLAFRAFLTGASGQAVFKGTPAAPVAIAKTNDTAVSGIPGGSRLWSVWSPFTNNTGKVAFRASLMDGSGNETRAIVTDTDGTLRVIAKVGQTAPGLGAETFVNFDHPIIGDGGQCAFMAATSSGAVGLFRQAAGGGALSLIMAVGDVVNFPGGSDTIALMVIPGGSTDDRKYETKAIDAAGRILVHVTYASGRTGIVLTVP